MSDNQPPLLKIYTCICCNYTSNNNNVFQIHCKTKKHILLMKEDNFKKESETSLTTIENNKEKPIYTCILCNFKTIKKFNYDTHLLSIKHRQKIDKDFQKPIKIYRCENCNRGYNIYQSYWIHKKLCIVPSSQEPECKPVEENTDIIENNEEIEQYEYINSHKESTLPDSIDIEESSDKESSDREPSDKESSDNEISDSEDSIEFTNKSIKTNKSKSKRKDRTVLDALIEIDEEEKNLNIEITKYLKKYSFGTLIITCYNAKDENEDEYYIPSINRCMDPTEDRKRRKVTLLKKLQVYDEKYKQKLTNDYTINTQTKYKYIYELIQQYIKYKNKTPKRL